MPYGVRYSTTARGSVPKRVVCEECGHEYGYYLDRSFTGSGMSYFLIARRQAQRTADRDAEVGLKERLRTECDPVPCPRCGWYQRAMVREYRRRLYQRKMVFAWAIVPVAYLFRGLVSFPVRLVLMQQLPRQADAVAAVVGWLPVLAALAVAGLLTFAHLVIAPQRNPNDDEAADERIEKGQELAMSQKTYDRVFSRQAKPTRARPVGDRDRPLPMTDGPDD